MAKRNTYFQDEVIERKIDMKQFGKILRYILPYRKIFFFVCALMVLSSIVSMIAPLLLKMVIDEVVVTEEYRTLVLVIAGMIVLAGIEIGVTYIHQRLMGTLGHNIIATVRKDIFYKLQQLSFEYFDSKPDGKIVVRVTEYINDLANFFTNYVLLLLTYIAKIVIVTFFMLGLSPQLTGIVFLTVIPMMICVFTLRYFVRRLFGAHRAKISNRTAFLIETIMGEKIVKNYNHAESSEEIYSHIHGLSLTQWMKIVIRNEWNTPIVETFWNIGTLCLYGLSLSMILAGNNLINAGTVFAFTNYMTLFSGPLTQIAFIVQQMAQVSSNLEQVFDTINCPVDIKDPEDPVELANVRGKIDFHNVTFAYDADNNILEHFDLHVSPGETIALVGPTGAGKTTVINMLTRFYDVSEGSVRVDDVDVRDVSLRSLRREVGVLMQDPFIFRGTVMENIRYGRLDATDEEVYGAARLANADQFIRMLPQGYGTMLTGDGEELSQGQRQLLAIARAAIADPPVLILDEATSSIDTRTEALVQGGMDELMKGRTVFVIAHRLSTIRNSDAIMVLDHGNIVERGDHESLIKEKGIYYQLYTGGLELD